MRRAGILINLNRILLYLAVILLVIFMFSPIAWMVLSSVQKEDSLLSVPPKWIPDQPVFDCYYALLTGNPGEKIELMGGAMSVIKAFPKAMINSFVIATLSTLLTLLLGAPSAYSIARLKVGVRRQLPLVILTVRMIPFVCLMIPSYLMMKVFGLLDTLWGQIVVLTGLLLPFTIWMLRGFYIALPRELEEAAMIDGCTRAQAFLKIVVPLSTPGLASVGLINFVIAWKEFLVPLVLALSEKSWTVPLTAAMLVTQFIIPWNLLNTVGVISIIPTVIFSVLFHKYIVSGLTAGALRR